MPHENFIAENDALLIPFLSAASEIEAEDCLNRLFEEIVIPQIRRVLTSYLTLSSLEKDELQSDAQTRVLGKLWVLRESVWSEILLSAPVKNFSAYISTVAFNCRKDFILRRKLEWRRTENRLSRLKDEADCVWHLFSDDEDHKLVSLKSKSKERCQIEFEEIVSRVRRQNPNHLFLKIQELVPLVLEMADGALTKNALVKAILEITDAAQFEETGMPEEMSEYLNHNDEEYLLAKRQKSDLRRIWEEVKTFPTNQRKVLLLSLKESRGVEAVSLLLKKRIASIREIADALEISKDEFFEIFIRLPMTSREIAEFLGIEYGEKTTKEQKVDNLRSIARDLLRRRLGIRQ